MDLEFKWLDDLLALAEAETLTLAAGRRNVTQPAFSRRIQRIEQWLGASILDRTRRPARVTPALLRKVEDIRSLTHDLRQLRSDIRNWNESQHRLVIAAQHSISVSFLPRFVASLQNIIPLACIRLRSANREECYSLMMTQQVAITIAHETDDLPLAVNEMLIEKTVLGKDTLCPVASPELASRLHLKATTHDPLPAIAFPPDVFLGAMMAREILPVLKQRHRLRIVCESALVPAVLELALAGVGVAWLPRSVCRACLQARTLVALDESFATARMNIVAERIAAPRSQLADAVWRQLSVFFSGGLLSQPGQLDP